MLFCLVHTHLGELYQLLIAGVRFLFTISESTSFFLKKVLRKRN